MSTASAAIFDRALGCLLGQLAGDTLGSLVEYKTPEQIRAAHPNGVREMTDGGFYNIVAGQPSATAELALALAYNLAQVNTYNTAAVHNAYKKWFYSRPFDCERAITNALASGLLDDTKQGSGALMRISPLGIFCARAKMHNNDMMLWARQDAKLTHPSKICADANLVFVKVLAHTIRKGLTLRQVSSLARETVKSVKVEAPVMQAVRNGLDGVAPTNYTREQGQVLVALQNAFYQLRKAKTPEDAIANTVACGGETDANAAIAGALFGAMQGAQKFPARWIATLETCQTTLDNPRVKHPRPQIYWPSDALRILPNRLLGCTPA